MTEHEERENTSTLGTFATVPAAPPPPKPSRTRIEIHVEGLPTIFFLGWRSTHAEIVVKATHGKMKWRAVVEALAECSERYGAIPAIGRAILRPGDTFDRETGKKLALARLVEALVPLPARFVMAETIPTFEGMRRERERVKATRSRLFLEIWRRTHKGALPKKAGRVWCLGGIGDPFHGKRDPEWRETLRGGGIPRGPIQGQTASAVIFDEVSKWPTPHEAPPSEKA